MASLYSNRTLAGNIALVIFLAFLATITLGMVPTASAADLDFDSSLEWQGTSADGPGAVIQDKDDDWQASEATVETNRSADEVTFTIQVLTSADFENIFFQIVKDGTVINTVYYDDTGIQSAVYNDVYGTVYSVYQLVYDWVYASGLDVDEDYTLDVYSEDLQIASITLDLEEPPPEGGGGGGGGGGGTTAPSTETTTETETTAEGDLQAGGTQTATVTSEGEASVTLAVDSAAIEEQIASSQVKQVVFSIPSEVTTTEGILAVTQAAVQVPADTIAKVFEAGKPVVVKLAGVELKLPPAAFDLTAMEGQDVQLSFNVSKVAEGTVPPPGAATYKIAGEVYSIEIRVEQDGVDKGSISSMSKPITLILPYEPAKVSSGSVLGIFRLTGGAWEPLGGTVDPVAHTVSVTRSSLSTYTVMSVPAAFSDTAGHWAEDSIKQLVVLGALAGYPDGTFKPDSQITRAEFAKVLVKAFKLSANDGKIFADTADHWAKDYIATAAARGVVKGYSDTRFGPDDLITREQMAAMVVRATGLETSNGTAFTDSGQVSGWAAEAVAIASANGIITGYPDGAFKPKADASRAEAATVVIRALQR